MIASDYLDLPYHMVIIPSENTDGFVGYVMELPGCMSQGDNWSDMYDMLREAMSLWIESTLEDGQYVPMPADLKAWDTLRYESIEEEQYHSNLKELHGLMDANPGSPEEARLEILSKTIEEYEKVKFPIDKPSLWARIMFRVRQQLGV